MLKISAFILAGCVLGVSGQGFSQEQVLDAGWHHLRSTGGREWSTFAATPENKKLTVNFSAAPNASEYALSLRQYDVKLSWRVSLNGKVLGTLIADENDLLCYFAVPAQVLKTENTLEISSDAASADDIRVGNVVLYDRPVNSVLSEGTVELEVSDKDSGEAIAARITITNGVGTLQSLSSARDARIAVRPGVVYTGNGRAAVGLPAGTYKLYASRGFEYGLDSAEVIIRKGERQYRRFTISREVPTVGWVSSDTHIHTLTWSGHGDASANERVLTIAGEGIELPVLTEHNLQMDMRETATSQEVQHYFTPVTGSEVTTPVGHFNVFPLTPGKTEIDHRIKTWSALSEKLGDMENSKVIILNHARDIHSAFRPFDPTLYLASAGMRRDGWEFPANAMEVINSGAQQTDQMELTRDWFGMLNHGHFITPAGGSDSHDVTRYIVGQARTYIRSSGEDPGNIDLQEVVRNFREGNVMVSFGLLAEIDVNDSYGPGELVPASDEMKISVRVSGPSWTRAERVILYANGKKIREEKIENQAAPGIKWSGTWKLTAPAHDVFLVALAEGPDPGMPHWPVGKPYQPTSPDWEPGIFGISGAVWLDADKNGKRDAAIHYARHLLELFPRDLPALIQSLGSYDEAVAIQVAALLHARGENLTAPEISRALRRASPETKAGFQRVITESGIAN